MKNFSIRKKVILSILLFTVVFSIILHVVSTQIILKSYLSVESDVVNKNIERVDNSLKNLQKEQMIKTRDWAVWDDSYSYVKNLDKQFEEDNLQSLGLFNLKINFIAFVNNNKEIVFLKVIDLNNQKNLESDVLKNSLIKEDLILSHDSIDSSKGGFIRTPYGIAMVSSLPILKSDGTGPVAGTLIFGNLLDKNITEKINNVTLYRSDIFDVKKNMPEDVDSVVNNFISREESQIKILDDDNVAGYVSVYDIHEDLVGIVRVVLPRTFYNKGNDSFGLFSLISSLTILFFGLFIVILMEYLIVRRFTKINKSILDISVTGDLSKRVYDNSDDEFGGLVRVINDLLEKINISQNNERKSQESERVALSDLKKRIDEAERINQLLIGREMKMIEIKKELDDIKSRD